MKRISERKMRIFHLTCILICAYSIVILIGEKYEVAYSSVDKSEAYHFLGCFGLKRSLSSYANQTKVHLDQLNEDLYQFFLKIKATQTREYQIKRTEHMFLRPIRSRNYFIYLNKICLSMDQQISHFHQLKEVEFFYFKKETFDFYRVTDSLDQLDQLVVEYREYPYSSCKRGFLKFKCLNDCFKESNRLSKYYYDGNETGHIFFDQDQCCESAKDDEDACFERCKVAENCKLTYFTPINMKKSSTIFIQALPLLSETNFWFQLMGLVCLILNIALFRLLWTLAKLVNRQIKNYILILLRIQIFLLIFACALYLGYSRLLDYRDKLRNPVRKETTIKLLEAEQFSLLVCVSSTSNKNGKTLLEIEKETDSLFNETVEDVFLVFQGKQFSIDWILAPNVFFFLKFRCFRVEVFPQVPRYQSLLSSSQVTVKFKHSSYVLYLLAKEQDFLPGTLIENAALQYEKDYEVAKRIIKKSRSKKNCTDYAEIYSNCNSQLSCINKCSNRYFYEKYGNVSTDRYLVISKDFYSPTEWASLFLIKASKFSDPIKQQCVEEFAQKKLDCQQIFFEYHNGYRKTLSYLKQDYTKRSVDLFYNSISSVEEEASIHMLLWDLVNIQSVFFGLTVLNLANVVHGLVRSKLKIQRGKKIDSTLIYLACSAGFLYQIVHIVNEMNGELIGSQHFDMLKSMNVPELVFCFEIPAFKQNLSGTRRLTGVRLNEITADLTTETVFQKVSYLNESNGWTEMVLSSSSFDFFYFANKKCFTVKLERQYIRKQFYFQHQTEVLRVRFQQPMAASRNPMHFMSRTGRQFSKPRSLSFLHGGKFHSIAQELFEINYQDKFQFIRNPLLLFHSNELNNAEQYLKRLAENFKRSSNSCTLNMPLEKEHFDLEIDDGRFERFFRDVQNVTDKNSPANPNHQRQIAINYLLAGSHNPALPHFIFSLIFFKKVVVLTNKSGIAALLLNILNAFSLWFHIHMLDIILNLYKIGTLFKKLSFLKLK